MCKLFLSFFLHHSSSIYSWLSFQTFQQYFLWFFVQFICENDATQWLLIEPLMPTSDTYSSGIMRWNHSAEWAIIKKKSTHVVQKKKKKLNRNSPDDPTNHHQFCYFYFAKHIFIWRHQQLSSSTSAVGNKIFNFKRTFCFYFHFQYFAGFNRWLMIIIIMKIRSPKKEKIRRALKMGCGLTFNI